MNEIIQKIQRSGLIETLWLICSLVSQRIYSYLRMITLVLRGYLIHPTVSIGRNVMLFQSKKNAIQVGKNSIIADGVRIKAGFDGKVIIGTNVHIHDYSFIYAHETLTIGNNTMISPQVFIIDFNHRHDTLGDLAALSALHGYLSKAVHIGSNVWIGSHSVILPGVSIGDNAIIGAGSVVTKDVPKFTTVVGNPAKVKKNNLYK